MLQWILAKLGNLFAPTAARTDVIDLLLEILNSSKDGKLEEAEVLRIKDKILVVLKDFGYNLDDVTKLLKK